MSEMGLGLWGSLHFSLMVTPLFMQVFALYNGSVLEWSKKSSSKQLSSKEYLSDGVRKTYNIYAVLPYFMYMLGVLLAIRPTIDLMNGLLMILPTLRFAYVNYELRSNKNKIDKEYEQRESYTTFDNIVSVIIIAHIVLTLTAWY